MRPTFASAASTYSGTIAISGVPLGAKVSKKPNEYRVIMGVVGLIIGHSVNCPEAASTGPDY